MTAGMRDPRFHMLHLAPGAPEAAGTARRIWRILERDGLTRATFYDGAVTSAEGFCRELLERGALSFALFWEGRLCGAAWCNTFEGRAARGHFVLFRAVWGRERTVPIGRGIFAGLLGLRDAGGFFFDVILGLTPERSLSWRLALRCGARLVGMIPNGVWLEAEGRSATAALVAATRESLEEAAEEEGGRECASTVG